MHLSVQNILDIRDTGNICSNIRHKILLIDVRYVNMIHIYICRVTLRKYIKSYLTFCSRIFSILFRGLNIHTWFTPFNKILGCSSKLKNKTCSAMNEAYAYTYYIYI